MCIYQYAVIVYRGKYHLYVPSQNNGDEIKCNVEAKANCGYDGAVFSAALANDEASGD